MTANLMMFDPAYGTPKPYPSEAKQYRTWHGDVAWLFNPWTGERRDPRDIGSDVTGILIRYPGEPLVPYRDKATKCVGPRIICESGLIAKQGAA